MDIHDQPCLYCWLQARSFDWYIAPFKMSPTPVIFTDASVQNGNVFAAINYAAFQMYPEAVGKADTIQVRTLSACKYVVVVLVPMCSCYGVGPQSSTYVTRGPESPNQLGELALLLVLLRLICFFSPQPLR